MFGLGLPEILVILIILFLLFGAKRLPQIGEGLGKTMKEIRKIRGEKESSREKDKENQEKDLLSDLKKGVEQIPGLKEAQQIKETANKVKKLTKFLK